MPDLQLKTLTERHVIGPGVRTTNRKEADPAEAQIGGLWQRYFAENMRAAISGQKDTGQLLGVYSHYESDANGAYTLSIAAEVEAGTPAPEGMGYHTIPAGQYLVFPTEGPMPDCVVNGWQAIWSYFENRRDYQRAYLYDFELYDMANETVEIYIGVKVGEN